MKKFTAGLLFAVFALVAPVCVHAQADNNAARIASQKRNLKRSQKEVRARNRAMRKALKSMHKRAHPHAMDDKGKTL